MVAPPLLNGFAMKNLRSVVALLFLAIGCGEGGKSQADSLNPPANIDAVSCFDIITSSTNISAECSTCCTEQGFPGATQYDGHCICGDRRDDSGDTVCAAQTASTSSCSACCADAGFNGYGFASSSSGPSACTCRGRSDSAVCASTLSAPSASTACRTCCLNNGYLGSGYSGGGDDEECTCLE
jgi:hypothetical protein